MALCYALTTPDPGRRMVQDHTVQGEESAVMSRPRMLDTKVMDIE